MNGWNRRLYFLAPNVEAAHKIVDDLLVHRVPEKCIHVIAREGTPLDDLPEADFRQKSNVVMASLRGLAIGLILGLIVGFIAWALVPGWFSSPALVAIIALAGALVGTWSASMIGVSASNRDLEAFESAIRRGELLMLVDVPRQRMAEIKNLVHKHHPEAGSGGSEPHKPVFP